MDLSMNRAEATSPRIRAALASRFDFESAWVLGESAPAVRDLRQDTTDWLNAVFNSFLFGELRPTSSTRRGGSNARTAGFISSISRGHWASDR